MAPPDFDDFDLFCFADSGMFNILGELSVEADGNGLQFVPDAGSQDLVMGSGGDYPAGEATLRVSTIVPSTFTAEWTLTFLQLPNDFTDLSHSHVFLNVTDAAGALAGFFFSKIGIAYAGFVVFPVGGMQLDTTFQVIPGSSDFVEEGVQYSVRVATNFDVGILYLYITPVTELAVTGHRH